ncbi:MAG: ArsS family sensor histidine kinase [Sulfurimonas sp.]|uniref:ArsS family sensor histidine kinase n=1 Tax=Sulfurimonas sp. TaxID=2022749 RepID=UPI002633112B|nr:ArsS family sensor histidine kinase [Sulfurimonas sp.]MDD3475908.1 ArsS family sensor histidine kinase [Sulfurimonas sp.]
MNKNSIILKISLFFLVAFFAMTFLFKMMFEYEFISIKENLKVHYHQVAKYVMLWHIGKETKEQFLQNLKKENIEIILDKAIHEDIIRGEKFETISCGMQNFDLYEKDNYRYMITPQSTGSMILKDLDTKPIDVYYMWWLYVAFILILFTLFLSIAISIYPLKHLQIQIRRFGEGDMDIDLLSSGKDEIAEVSNEFDKAVKKIKAMINSRAIFIRNITHELKTPITKGRLSLEFLEDSRTKDILSNVFLRLNLLTKEIVQIENITACDCYIDKKSYRLSDILDNAVDLLFLEIGSIDNNLENKTIEADFELMSIVFKNLIDNGIKYSSDSNVYIKFQDNSINFYSKGNTLESPLEYYTQPFTKCDSNISDSFGLGLYIVNYILEKHEYSLSHEYNNSLNCFSINLKDDSVNNSLTKN